MRNPTHKEQTYVNARLSGRGVADSYRAAYDCSKASDETVRVRSSEIEQRPMIRKMLEEGRAEMQKAATIDMLWVLREWAVIATADPSELTTTAHDACRHCWGFDFGYHWRDEEEWAAECAKAIEAGKPAPEMAGGFGYRRLKGPNVDCPKCEGLGITRTHVADMSKVSPSARKLFAGVEQTKNGIKVLTRNQDDAVRNIAKALGGMIDRVQHSGAVGVVPVEGTTLTDEQRAKVVQALTGLL